MDQDLRTYERLLCCACGKEVKPGTIARSVPALQPGSNQSSSPRPHVWCGRCLREEQLGVEARPEPRELEREPTYRLHRYIWTIGEGRSDADICDFYRACHWPDITLGSLLRELTEAGKIERRGDRRVALCAPWQEPKAESYTEAEAASIYAGPATPDNAVAIPDDYASVPPGAMPAPQLMRDVPIRGICQQCGKPSGRAACESAFCAFCSPLPQMARTRKARGVPTDEEIDLAFGPKPIASDDDLLCYDDDLPDPEALQADRYPVDPNDDRLMMIEKLLRKLLERIDHLVCMDNEK